VTTRLYPDTEETVTVQYDPSRRHHERRRRDMMTVHPGEGIARPLEPFERRGDRIGLALVNRIDPLDLRAKRGQ
jgi:hypothetical protein